MLKTRLLTVAIWLPILIGIFIFSDTVSFNICVSLITVIAVYEIFNTLGYKKNLPLLIISICYAAIMPFSEYLSETTSSFLLYLYVLSLFVILIIQHKTLKIENIGIAFLFTYFFSLSFSTLVGIRRLPFGEYYIYLAFAIPWISDTMAYAFGKLLGKTKLCPEISPKKTVVGAIAASFGGIVSILIFKWVVETFFALSVIHLAPALLCGLVCSVLSEIGDLSASVLKRQCQVKDFGNFFPGHGGIMDRFDSVLFAAPALYVFFKLFCILI